MRITTTAHISAMFFVFYSAGLALGAPPLLYAFIMITSSNIMIIMLLEQLLLSLGQIMLFLRDGGGG